MFTDKQSLPDMFFDATTDDTASLHLFRPMVYRWYAHNGRDTLPWRQSRDTYAILVSEIMLQQTQVDRVVAKYEPFLHRFPDIRSLADAGLHDVLALWQGLGYNRRALNLHRCAQEVMRRFDGNIPDSLDALHSLPGIGPYTACALCTFAWNQPHVFIETNIRSVFIHYFFTGQPAVADGEIIPLVAATLDNHNPRHWYYALMDLGAAIKRIHGNPSRRSSRYTRQSRFEGSDRQVRGMILKLLTRREQMTRDDLVSHINRPQETVERCVRQLLDEGFLCKTDNRYAIR